MAEPAPTASIASASWRFSDGFPVTIICSELSRSDEVSLGPLSVVDNPNYTRLYSFADADALVELFGYLNASNPGVPISYLLASQVTFKDLSNHIVLLGGIAWNDVTRRLNAGAELPIRQVRNEKIHSGEVFEIEGGPHGQPFLPAFRTGTREPPTSQACSWRMSPCWPGYPTRSTLTGPSPTATGSTAGAY
jgi:hypothetical protein